MLRAESKKMLTTRFRVTGALSAIAVLLSATISWADTVPNHVRDVRVHPAEGIPGGTEIEVVGTGTPSFSVRVADGGRKLLVDLANADVFGAPEAITKPEGPVGGVLTQGFKTDAGQTTRLVISLSRQATYRLKADGSTLRVFLAPGATTTSSTTIAAVPPRRRRRRGSRPPAPSSRTFASSAKGTRTASSCRSAGSRRTRRLPARTGACASSSAARSSRKARSPARST